MRECGGRGPLLDEGSYIMFGVLEIKVDNVTESNEGSGTMKGLAYINAENQDVKEWLAYQSLLRGTQQTLAEFIVMRDEWEADQLKNPCEVWMSEDTCTCGDRGVCPTCDPAEWDVSTW